MATLLELEDPLRDIEAIAGLLDVMAVAAHEINIKPIELRLLADALRDRHRDLREIWEELREYGPLPVSVMASNLEAQP
jgi:hypothetical protein